MERVLIVGAGLAGLCCALDLQAAGAPCLLLEQGERPGGRVRTDLRDGFRLDRGFQVYLTAYPEGKSRLDYDSLQLQPFLPGALIRRGGRFRRFVDPIRLPAALPETLLHGPGSLLDKARVASLRTRLLGRAVERIWDGEECPTRERLRRAGFSAELREAFFRPFFGGVFLEAGLETSSRMFEFCFRMFSAGPAALPEAGMEAIPRQLAARLAPGSLRTGAAVHRIYERSVQLASGEQLEGQAVVLAVEEPAAARLLDRPGPREFRSTVCLYYAAPEPPIREPILVLNGEGDGPVNHLCVPSQVAPAYAPPGRSLVSASVIGNPARGDAELRAAVDRQLQDWFGAQARSWELLELQRIAYALPAAPPPLRVPGGSPRLWKSLYACGDYLDSPSINGAMASGRRAAAAVLQDLRQTRGSVPPRAFAG